MENYKLYWFVQIQLTSRLVVCETWFYLLKDIYPCLKAHIEMYILDKSKIMSSIQLLKRFFGNLSPVSGHQKVGEMASLFEISQKQKVNFRFDNG